MIGAEVGKLVGPSLQSVFKWTQTGFANATKQTITIAGQAYTYFIDAGVKLTKSLFQSVGGAAGGAVKQASLHELQAVFQIG